MGKAGHLAVMSEFLLRGWNVAIPEVDVGDDIFVVKDEDGTFRRVQVKTAQAQIRKNGHSCQFSIPVRQIRNLSEIPVHFVFIVRTLEGWSEPLIIRQDILFDLFRNSGLGTQSQDKITFYFSYQKDKVICSQTDLTPFVNDFSDFKVIPH
ncbi:MAG: hypothetical protein H6581_12840 [Bacteroidia bacterium]|nr:hypothetical protein [Bacteroidia bacterium]